VSENGHVWKHRLSKAGSASYPLLSVNLPAALSRALAERGLYNVEISLTDAGILMKPYPGEPPSQAKKQEVELPEAWS